MIIPPEFFKKKLSKSGHNVNRYCTCPKQARNRQKKMEKKWLVMYRLHDYYYYFTD